MVKGQNQGVNSGEIASELELPAHSPPGAAGAKTGRCVGSGLVRPPLQHGVGESREEKQGGRTWHKLLIIAEKRHFDLRFSDCLSLLGVLSISVWQ